MAKLKPKVGVVFTLLELYRKAHPDRPEALGNLWRGIVEDLLSESADLNFTGVSHTCEEVNAAVASCEKTDCDLLVVLPMAYAASGCARHALCETTLPLLLVSTARDATLPYDMTGDHIMANHAMHGVRKRLLAAVRAAAGSRVIRAGKVGRIGKPFDGMLDFRFERESFATSPLMNGGFEVVEIEPEQLRVFAEKLTTNRIAEVAEWATSRFTREDDLTDEELTTSARYSLALEDLVTFNGLDAVSMNFLEVAAAGAATMPFLGACRLMDRGVGYAGEGDVLTAALVGAASRIAGEATFTEMFCPDYERDEVLLSHMGECNPALTSQSRPGKLVAKDFPYGDCMRPAVPVFQLREGVVTLASLTEWPGDGFRLVTLTGEVIAAPEHENLSSPYTRIRFGRDLAAFLEDYSCAGGTHHLALVYGDLTEAFGRLAGFCGMTFRAV